jgi:hypothetical protein
VIESGPSRKTLAPPSSATLPLCLAVSAILIFSLLGPAGHAGASGASDPLLTKSSDKKKATLRWEPPQVDAPIASLAMTPPCSLPDVLNQAGMRATSLVSHLQNFTAHERIRYEEMDDLGNPDFASTEDFDYFVDFGEKAGALASHETRTQINKDSTDVREARDTGLAVLALIFHPLMRDDYDMRCEGYGAWNEQPAWVVRFQQKKDKKPRTLSLHTPTSSHNVSLKGRAWIAADSGEIMHLETNLVAGIAILGLQGNAVSVDYGPVQFHSQQVELWLPKTAQAYADYGKRRTIIDHTFSEFQLFSVQTQQQIEKPKE